jgi:hypothetical protein
MWAYTPSVHKTRPLGEHIDALWRELKPHKAYLLRLKKSLTVGCASGLSTKL